MAIFVLQGKLMALPHTDTHRQRQTHYIMLNVLQQYIYINIYIYIQTHIYFNRNKQKGKSTTQKVNKKKI